mgnify:FL=1
MGLVIVVLNAAGVAPTPAKLQEYQLRYRERAHHVHVDFGTTRTKDPGASGLTIGLGYEYYADRRFNGVSVEVLGQRIGELLDGGQDWWVGAGIGWWPIRELKVFTQAGALWDDNGRALQARVGVGYRVPFFMMAVMPYVYVEGTDDGRFSWSLAARIQY